MPVLRHFRYLQQILCMCCACYLAIAASSLPGYASSSIHTTMRNSTITQSGISDVQIGFSNSYRLNRWIPVQINLQGGNTAFLGTLVVQTCNFIGPSDSMTPGTISPWRYTTPLMLQPQQQRLVTITIPFSLGNFQPQGVIVTLEDQSGVTIATQTAHAGYAVQPEDLFAAFLSDHSQSLNNTFISVFLPNESNSPTGVGLNSTSFPSQATILNNFDVIVLNDFDSRNLSAGQINALRTWISQGGVLIEVGGPDWRRTLGPLPTDLLPVTLQGTQMLPAGTPLLPDTVATEFITTMPTSSPLAVSRSIPHPTSTLREREVVHAVQGIPLMVKARQGQGVICYLAYDPTDPSLQTGNTPFNLWQSILLYTLEDKFLISSTAINMHSGPGQLLQRTNILKMLAPDTLSGPWLLLLLLAGYALALGPLRLLLQRYLKPVYLWRWRLFLAGILLASLLTYPVAAIQRTRAFDDTSISLIQVNQDGYSAHVTTYHGIYVPANTSFNAQFPTGTLVQPPSNNLLAATHLIPYSRGENPLTITYDHNGTTIQQQNIHAWNLYPLITEQDSQLGGSLETHFTWSNQQIVGTISNHLPTSLSDVYILLAHGIARVGSLAAGETRELQLPVTTTATTTQAQSLADLITQQNGLPANYFPYTQHTLPGDDLQRHMAELSVLHGMSYTFQQCARPCNQHSLSWKGDIFIAEDHSIPNPTITYTPDPLLLRGAPATLIGWTDQPLPALNTVTINQQTPGGRHDGFLQVPLSLNFQDTHNIPPDLLAAHVVNIDGYDAQTPLQGVYTVSNSAVTFSMFAPPSIHPTSLTIVVPDLLANPPGQSSKVLRNISFIQAQLYNWQTRNWDTIHFDLNTYTTSRTSTYIGPDHKVLLRINNEQGMINTLIFTTPSLRLN